MMKKEKITYYFSVEGETEKWYLDWLQNLINATPEATCMVRFDSKIQKDPLKRVKGMTILGKTQITHVFDRESEESKHTEPFATTLERMKQAQQLGKTSNTALVTATSPLNCGSFYTRQIAMTPRAIDGSILPRSMQHLMRRLKISTSINTRLISNVLLLS